MARKPARKRKAKEPVPEVIPEVTAPELKAIEEQSKKSKDKRIGNEFWKARSSHGPKFKYNAVTLAEGCEEYFQWCADHPLYERKPFAFQGTITWADVPKMRGTTLEGLCIFLDISMVTWFEYKKNKDLTKVVRKAGHTMDAQKLTGAMADMLNPNIVARYIGLKDANSHEHTGKDGKAIEIDQSVEGDIEQARRVAFMLGTAIERKRGGKDENSDTDAQKEEKAPQDVSEDV